MKRAFVLLVVAAFVLCGGAALAQPGHGQGLAKPAAAARAKPKKPAMGKMAAMGQGGMMAMMMVHMKAAGGAAALVAGGEAMAGCGMMAGMAGGYKGPDLAQQGLSQAQLARVRELAHAGLKKLMALHGQICALCLEAAYQMSAPTVDQEKLAQTMAEIGRLRAAAFMVGREYLAGLADTVGPEQAAWLGL